jgi:hypothetical protein
MILLLGSLHIHVTMVTTVQIFTLYHGYHGYCTLNYGHCFSMGLVAVFWCQSAAPHCCVLLVPLHNFCRPPFCYYRLYDIQKHDFQVFPNGTTPVESSILIRPVVLELKHEIRRTDGRDVT